MIHFEYDGLNRKIFRTDADGRVTNYEYDTAGNLIEPVSNIKEGEPFAPPESVTRDEDTSVSYYPEGQSSHFGQRHSANAGGVSSLSLHREVFGAFKSKAYQKSTGDILKQNAKATSGTAVKGNIQKVKQVAARVLNKVSSGKSKGGTAAKQYALDLRTKKVEKRINHPPELSADEILENAKQTVSKISPSVKPVSGTQTNCSVWESIQRGYDIRTNARMFEMSVMSDGLWGMINAAGRNLIDTGAIIGKLTVNTVTFPINLFGYLASSVVNYSTGVPNQNIVEYFNSANSDWTNYVDAKSDSLKKSLEKFTKKFVKKNYFMMKGRY